MKQYDIYKEPDDPTITISGNTYSHKEFFKSKFELSWDPEKKVWHGSLNVSDQSQLIAYCKLHSLHYTASNHGQKPKQTSVEKLNYYSWKDNACKIYCLDNHTTQEIIGQRGNVPIFKRTGIGELLYNFKYCDDEAAGQQIVSALAVLAKSMEFDRGDLIIPVPPTIKNRSNQPVLYLAKELARRIDVPMLEGLSSYNKIEQKNTKSHETRRKELMKSVGLTTQCNVKGRNVILMDDIYGTGLTIDVCSRKLELANAGSVVALLVTKKK